MKQLINIKVNGDHYNIAVNPWRTLNEVLREDLNLTGTKFGCGSGDCGACTVIINKKTVNSCLTLAIETNGKSITTIEGVATSGENLHPIQKSFIDNGAIQCGFCTPGMVMSALYLLKNKHQPNNKEIRKAISGNLCRCTGYNKIITAIAKINKKNKKQLER